MQLLFIFSFWYFFNLILLFNFTILYWFCHISKWIYHRYTCVPHPEPFSLLPPHTIPLGHPSAPAPSIQYRAWNLDWWLVTYMILYIFQCHSPKCHSPNAILPNAILPKKAEHQRIDAFKLWSYSDSWESLGGQGDHTNQSKRKPTLNVHWKDWH